MITAKEFDEKYPAETPAWRKDPFEWYKCEKHDKPVIYIRDYGYNGIVLHTDTEDECR